MASVAFAEAKLLFCECLISGIDLLFSTDELLSQMYVIDRVGSARGGVEAVKYLSRKLPLLWPLAGLLHIPGSMPLWRYLYRVVARNRMRFAGRCDDGHCRVN